MDPSKYNLKSGSHIKHGTDAANNGHVRKNDNKKSHPDFVIGLSDYGKPVVLDCKAHELSHIPKAELEKLQFDKNSRNGSGAVLVIKKGATMNNNAYEYAKKHNILIIEIDRSNPTEAKEMIKKAVDYY